MVIKTNPSLEKHMESSRAFGIWNFFSHDENFVQGLLTSFPTDIYFFFCKTMDSLKAQTSTPCNSKVKKELNFCNLKSQHRNLRASISSKKEPTTNKQVHDVFFSIITRSLNFI